MRGAYNDAGNTGTNSSFYTPGDSGGNRVDASLVLHARFGPPGTSTSGCTAFYAYNARRGFVF
jgi:hypothetical protein